MTAVLVLAGASGAAGTQTVSVKDNFFSPKSISVSNGTTVKWVWRGKGLHNVVGTRMLSERVGCRTDVSDPDDPGNR